MTLQLRHTVIAALLCGTFISTAPAFAGGILGGGGLGGTIGGGGTLGAAIPSLPPAPIPSGHTVGKVSADVGVGADVNGRAAINTVTGTAGTLRGNVEAAGNGAVSTANKGVRIVNRTGAAVKGSAEAAADAGVSKAGGAAAVVSEADAKLNLDATASASSDVSSSLKTVGKANADASGDAWFDIF